MTAAQSPRGRIAQAAMDVLLHRIAPHLDQRIPESSRPFRSPEIMRPHHDSKLWGWTHYGVFIPELPGPYRYLNTMTFIGTTGTLIFDNDYLAAPDVRQTATVLSSTAYGPTHHYEAYDARTQCDFAADGSTLSWGDDLTITAEYPRFTVTGRYQHMTVDLDITATEQVSWFVKTPIYDHLSLLATFKGTISDTNGETPISGLCTVEYARSMSPQSVSSRPLPESLKLPVDFFTYQIVNLDDRTQLLLTDVRASGATACRLAQFRTLDGSAWVQDDVTLDVLEYQKVAVDPRGRAMRVPARLRWTVRDGDREVVSFEATLDSPLRYGHGRGYVGAYTYDGRWDGRDIGGTGYIEWVDCE